MTKENSIFYYDSNDRKNKLWIEIRELYYYRDLIWQMTLRNVTVRYKRSILGVLWTMLEPLLTMVVMAVVFTALLDRKIPHFPIYLLSGIVVWNYFAFATQSAMHDFIGGEQLIGRVYLPRSIFVVTAITTGLVNFLISFAVLLLIALATGAPVSVYTFLLFFPIVILTAFNLGIGLWLAPLQSYFTDTGSIYGIALRLLIYLSAIFYPIDALSPILQMVVNLNPVYQFIHIFRNPVYYGTAIPLLPIVYTTILAIVLLISGAFFFVRLSDRIAEKF